MLWSIRAELEDVGASGSMVRYAPLGAIRVVETRLTRASGLVQPIVSTRPSLIHTSLPGHHLTSVV